jgi:hypothetical protein
MQYVPGVDPYVVDGLELNRIGEAVPPGLTPGRLSLNDERRVEAHALPASVSNMATSLIDWRVTVNSYDLKLLDKGTDTTPPTLPELPEANWPADNSEWGSKMLVVGIDKESIDASESGELNLTGPASLFEAVYGIYVHFEKIGPQNPGPDPNWYEYWASDKSGPCEHKVSGSTSYMGATITWDYDLDLGYDGTCTRQSPTAYLIRLGPGAATAESRTFSSPEISFTDSQGQSASFAAGHIAWSFVREAWQAVDSVQHTINHEKTHVLIFRNWEAGGSWRTALGGAARSTGTGGNDQDDDWLPDFFEDGYGTRFDQKQTFTSGYCPDDGQVYCEHQAGNPSIGETPPAPLDWAHPGKQWH